jgi:hypothetical protein
MLRISWCPQDASKDRPYFVAAFSTNVAISKNAMLGRTP